MKKSELLGKLQRREKQANASFEHYDTLGQECEAAIFSKVAREWDFLADLVIDSIAKEGDEEIYEDKLESIPATDPHKDDETYMPFDTDLGKGFM